MLAGVVAAGPDWCGDEDGCAAPGCPAGSAAPAPPGATARQGTSPSTKRSPQSPRIREVLRPTRRAVTPEMTEPAKSGKEAEVIVMTSPTFLPRAGQASAHQTRRTAPTSPRRARPGHSSGRSSRGAFVELDLGLPSAQTSVFAHAVWPGDKTLVGGCPGIAAVKMTLSAPRLPLQKWACCKKRLQRAILLLSFGAPLPSGYRALAMSTTYLADR